MGGEYVSRDYLLGEYDRQHQGSPGGARKIIAEAPAADVVEVVRCTDCEYTEIWHDRIYCQRLRDRWNHCNDRWVNEADFCAWGKRKDGGTDA